MAKTRSKDKMENQIIQLKQTLNRMTNIVSNQVTLQDMACAELLSRKEKYINLKKTYDEKYEEFCKLADNLDLQQFIQDTEDALAELDRF